MNTKNLTELKPNHRTFVEEYLSNGGQARKAAIAAGYAENSAHVTASRLLRKPQIVEVIREKTVNRAKVCSPIAMEILITIANDINVAPRDRISAAKEVLNRGGITHENPMVQINVKNGARSAADLIAEIEAERAAAVTSKNE